MSTLDTCTNWKGEVTGYIPQGTTGYYWHRHHMTAIQAKLKAFCTPFVEAGFDAQQIKAEMQTTTDFQNSLIAIGQIESVISIILGEQQ